MRFNNKNIERLVDWTYFTDCEVSSDGEVTFGGYIVENKQRNKAPRIEKVVFNAPATVVLWDDGTKTVVKCDRCGNRTLCKANIPYYNCDKLSFWREDGLLCAIAKKLYPRWLYELEKWV